MNQHHHHPYEYSPNALHLLHFIWNSPPNAYDNTKEENDPWTRLQIELLDPSCSALDRHDVALCLLADIVFLDTIHSEESIRLTLDACGPEACLSASSMILSDLAKESDSNLLPSFPWILRTIRRLFLNNHPPNQYLSSVESNPMQQQDAMVQSLLRLPLLISNACLMQKLKLPSWAVRNTYFTRLLQASSSQPYFTILLPRLIQIGATDSIANAMTSDPIDWTQIPTQRDRVKLMEAIIFHHLKNTLNKGHLFSDCKTKKQGNWKEVAEVEVLPFVSLHCLPALRQPSKHSSFYDSVPQQFVQRILYSKKFQELITYPQMNCILPHVLALLLQNCGNSFESDSDDTDEDEGEVNDEESNSCNLERDVPDGGHVSDAHSVTESVLYQVVQTVADSWNTRSWVQRIDARIQRRVTNFLLSSLPLMSWSKSQSSSSPVIITLIRGISIRLESSLISIRIDGMKIAQLLAGILGGEVHFEELEDYDDEQDWDDCNPTSSLAEAMPKENSSDQLQKNDKSTRVLSRRRYVDPNAEYVSSDSEQESHNTTDDEDSIDWEDELIPATGLDDTEEDLRPTPIPIYLRECLELLQTPESHALAYSRHQTALQYLPIVLQNNPLDLNDVTVPLTKQLFRMEDKFGIDGFHDLVRSNTVALTVQDAVAVGDCVMDYIFDDVSLHTRMLGLYTLETSARMLSGAKAIPAKDHKLEHDRDTWKERVLGNRRLVPNQGSVNGDPNSKTRRWGRLQHPNHRETVSNKFSSIAPRWFYTMIGNFMKRKDDVKLWGGANGARLLAQILVTLATVIESCMGTTPSIYLARDLLYFSWTFRTSDDPTLRSAVLVAIASSLACHLEERDPSILFPTIVTTDRNLPEFLAETMQSDPDDVCRQLAKEISKTALQMLKNHPNDALFLP